MKHVEDLKVSGHLTRARRLVKKAVQQGRSKRGGEAYSEPYVEPLSAVRTPLTDFFSSLQERGKR